MTTLNRDIETIFNSAVARPTAEERQAYLDGACGDDAQLRGRIDALLEAHSSAGGFLEKPPFGEGPTIDTSPLSEGAGTRIGPYKLLQAIGEGGFGAVYMAQQERPVRRTVALKIIKLGMDTRQVIARFEAERQALAMMDHPNIAKVLDAGATETGRPYFVMELVKGIPITEYCDKNNLSTEERLDLFVDVCHAVQHAHQKGIIHRDIKPSNVMVTLHDGRPIPKVIDFGIAKATNQRLTEKTLFTQFRQFVGTPEYMSPEQAEMSGLDIDTRTDIYSLGVLLYELLTGTTPFDSKTLREAGYGEIQKIIREREPDRPSTRLSTMGDELTGVAKHRHTDPGSLRKQLKGDLDWIVMKAIEKDRTRRYETANGLSMDVTRYLVDEPVLATPPSTVYRLRKFARRNKAAVRGGLAVAAVFVIGFSLSTVGFVQANRQRALMEVEAAKAAAVASFMQEMLASVSPSVAKGREFTLVTMLEDAGARLDEGALEDQGEIEAAIRVTISDTYGSLGLYPAAIPHLERAVELRREHLGDEHEDTLLVMGGLASEYSHQGRPRDAEPLITHCFETLKRTRGPEHPDTLDAMYYYAWNQFHVGREEEGERLHKECLALRREALGENHWQTLGSWNCSGLTHAFRDQYEEAEPFITEAYEVGRQALGKDHRNTLLFANNLAEVYIHLAKYEEAVELLEENIPISRRAFGPTSSGTNSLIGKIMTAYASLNRHEDARPWAVQAIETRKRLSVDSPSDPTAHNNYAWILLTCEPADLRDPEAALEAATRANELTNYQSDSFLDTLAMAYFKNGFVDKAIETQRTAVEMLWGGQFDRAEMEERLQEYKAALAADSSSGQKPLAND